MPMYGAGLGDRNRAVRLLIVSTTAIQVRPTASPEPFKVMNEVALSGGPWLETNAGSPRLKRFAVEQEEISRNSLLEGSQTFNIVRFGGRKAMSPVAKQHRAVVQTEFLENASAFRNQRLVFFVTFLRMRELKSSTF